MARNLPNEQMYENIKEWLLQYHSTDNSKKKNKLKAQIVTHMVPVVKRIAKTIARRSYDPIDDLVQAGFIGLLKAIDRFDFLKNDNFRVYAGYLIVGEIKHYIRDKSAMIRVPSYIQELSIRINSFTQTLTEEDLQNLTSDEVASALNVPTKAVDFALLADRRRSTVSIEEAFKAGAENLTFDEMFISDNYKDKSNYEDAKIIFNSVIEYLPPEEKLLINMYYKQDMNQKEIAEALHLTQMAVSRRMKNTFALICQLIDSKNVIKKEGA